MKKILLAFSIVGSLTAQAQKIVKLHGAIKNRLNDTVVINVQNDKLKYEPDVHHAMLDKNGHFSIDVPVSANFTQITVENGEQATDLVVAPGYDLDITVDAAHFDSSLHYSGKGSNVANFVAKHVLNAGMMAQYGIGLRSELMKDAVAYKNAEDKELQKEMNFLDENKAALPKDFINYWTTYYRYAAYADLLRYPIYHQAMVQHTYNINFDNLTKDDFAIANDVPFAFNDELLPISTYRYYLDNLFTSKLRAQGYGIDSITRRQLPDSARSFAIHIAPPKTAAYYLGKDILFATFSNLDTAEVMMADFKKRWPGNKHIPELEQIIASKKQLQRGKDAIDFTIHTREGKTMKLSDLKGKVVLLDFWASWCGPCISQMPSAKKVEEHFEGKDVVFLYVSIDADETQWEKAIDKYEIKGTHMRDGDKNVADKYGVYGVPTYFLIDKNGKFAAVGNLPRPSQTEELEALIEKQL